jgi:phosphoribosylformylglycinamidine synthase
LLGETRAEFGGSLWAWLRHGHLGGMPPAVDLEAERALADVLVTAAARGLLVAAHDISDGGLAMTLAESCLAGGTGCTVTLPADAATFLFSESAGRAVVAVRPGAERALADVCEQARVPALTLGQTGGHALEVSGLFAVPLDELREVHRGALPALFG